MRAVDCLLVLAVALGCSNAATPKPRAAGPVCQDPFLALDAGAVTHVRWARRELWSWTKTSGAEAIAREKRFLRYKIHTEAPDDSFYDLHVRRSGDAALSVLLTKPPFDMNRYAWATPWGAADGLDDEQYGDQLIHVVLRADAVIARFVPLTEGEGDAPDAANPFRAGLPEWTFATVDGTEVSRAEVLAHPGRLAAVFHVCVNRDPDLGRYVGYREYVLTNEAAIERWEIGGPPAVSALDASSALLRALLDSGAVPPLRDDDDRFLAKHVLARATWTNGFGALSLEERWLLTLPFPRSQYRDLPRLLAKVDAARTHQGPLLSSPPSSK